MPRKIAVPPEESIQVVKKFMHHFETDPLPAWSAKVWKEMSIALGGKWSFAACYTNVRNDRNSILSIARREMGIIVSPKFDQNNNSSLAESIISVENSDRDESYSESYNDTELDIFDLVLTEQQWNEIKPDIKREAEGNSRVQLKPGIWTNEIAISFFQQYRLPCAFVFKRAEVTLSENDMIYTIKITGSCKSKKCHNIFRGYAQKRIGIDGLTIQIQTRDTRTENHEPVKRPLNGKRRREIQKDMRAEGCSEWRKRQAREIMWPGETEPPTLPNGDVLRQARKEGFDAELGIQENDGRDFVRAIEEMSLKPEFAGLIHDVGLLPFHICYSTQAQLHAYKEYCRLNEKSVISLDSTGSVVRRLDRRGQKSGHIFLYAIVINFDNTTISVHQMLSEKHTTEFIELWLRQWQRSGAPKPKQVVCDFSRALLCGVSLAFNNQTVKSYIDDLFNITSRSLGFIKKPDTIIRVDVAHLIAAVCRWNCWKSVRHICIKEFFVRCIALMVECVMFSDFEKIFYLTCVVGLQIHQDVEIDYSEILTAKDARKKLEEEIAVRGIKGFDVQNATDELEDLKAQVMTEYNELDQNSTRIGDWVDRHVTRAKKVQRDGEELNPFFLPEFVNMLSSRAKEFPLWTNVGMDFGTAHATSSYVESYFNDIKTRVLKKGPMRVDKFLIMHARDIHGATLLFSSRMINFNAERYAQSAAPIEKERESKMNEHHGKLAMNVEEGTKIKLSVQSTKLRTDVNNNKNLNNNGKKTYFDQSLSSNQRNNFDMSSGQSVKLKMECKHEGLLCSNEIPTNDIKCYSCNSNLFATENWRENCEVDEFVSDHLLEPNLKNVSYFIEVVSNDNEVCHDSDLLAVENWRGKVQVNDNLDYHDLHDLNMEISNDHNVYENAHKLPRELEITNKNVISMNASFLDHSYSSMSTLKTDLAGSNSNEESDSIPSTHLVSKSNKPLEVCQNEKKKISKYFKAYPEIRQRNALVGQKKKSTLLPHGSLRPPIKIKDNKGQTKSYSITNTCAFDSIVHVLMTGAIDNVNYCIYLKASSNPTLRLVYDLIHKGLTQNVLRQRVSILKTYYACKPQVQTHLRVVSYNIDALDNIANVVKKVLATEPSVINTIKCNSCNDRTYPTIVLEPNHAIIGKEGFGSLEKSLGFRSLIYQVRCEDPCLGKYTWFKELRKHIFIELDIRPDIRYLTGLTCRIEQMPTTLHLQYNEETNFEYSLSGIVAYISGHYISFCRRSSGVWEKYDDLQKEVIKCAAKNIINPHLAVYIQI